MADPVRRLFDEYRRHAAAGELPDVVPYLERAGKGADALADLLDDFLQHVPVPHPTPEAIAAVRAIAEGEPSLLAQRRAAGVTRDRMIDILLKGLSLPRKMRAKLELRYHELEAGLLDAGHVDVRVLDTIAQALGTLRDRLVFTRPRPAGAAAYLRRQPGTEPLGVVAYSRTPLDRADEPDEVDRLFGVAP
jgi:hypothetical protein